MSRRNIVLIVIFIGIVGLMMVAGNAIIVAQRFAVAAHFPALEYIIYGVLGLLFLYVFVVPFMKIHMTPALPALSVDRTADVAQLRQLAAGLGKTMGYIADKPERIRHRDEFLRRVAMAGNNASLLAAAIDAEISCRIDGIESLGVKGINNRVIDWATSTFMITAVSQNGKFDTLSIIYLNIRMISDIVHAAGFRPTRMQLFRLYANVLVTSLMTFVLSGALEDTGDLAPFAAFGDDAAADMAGDAAADGDSAFSPYAILKGIKIPGVMLGSALDGAANALMTMRIGYITVSYITEGAAAFRGMAAKRQIKRQAMLRAVKGLPAVVTAGSSVVGKTVASAVLKVFRTK